MKTIFLVDDSATILLSISGILSKAGYGVEKAPSALDALKKFQAGVKVDLLITDLHLWRVGNGRYAGTLSLLSHDPTLTPLAIRELLANEQALVHLTVEIHPCDTCR